jgi:hypothetical protein
MILEPANAQDALRPLRQQNLVDAANDSLNTSAAGRAQVVSTGRGTGVIVTPPPMFHQIVWVIAIDPAAGAGFYYGKILDDPDTLPSGGDDLTGDMLGAIPDGVNDTIIMNGAEEGETTHALTTEPITQTRFPGELLGVNSDGKYVVRIYAAA